MMVHIGDEKGGETVEQVVPHSPGRQRASYPHG